MRRGRPAARARQSLGRRGDEEAATTGAGLTHQREAGSRVLRPLDDDVLQKIGEARLDRPFVARFDFQVIGDGALLVHLAVRLYEDGSRRVAVPGARGVELLERFQAGLEACKL